MIIKMWLAYFKFASLNWALVSDLATVFLLSAAAILYSALIADFASYLLCAYAFTAFRSAPMSETLLK